VKLILTKLLRLGGYPDKMVKAILTLAALCVSANAVSLTSANWDEETSGKTVLIKFQAPW